MITPKELKARYPYQFAGPYIELSFFKGWMPLFAQLCADIDAELGPDKRNFNWVQTKEKFGAARFYSQMDRLHDSNEDADKDDRAEPNPHEVDLRRRIVQLQVQAGNRTQTLCIVCGETGDVDLSHSHRLVLCPEHARQRRRGDMEAPWFSAEEKGDS